MTVTVYRSTDAGAPPLDGTAGSFVDVLDWCLVSGAPTPAGWTIEFTSGDLRSYRQGSLTVTAVVTGLGGTWTVSGNHEESFYEGLRIHIEGDTGGGDGVYTTVSATNNGANTDIVVSQTIPGGSAADGVLFSNNSLYFGVDDSGTTLARIRGFETMTAAGVSVASGTGPFPTDAQTSGGSYISKSQNATSDPRAWTVIADDRAFYIWINRFANYGDINYSGGPIGSAQFGANFFGDIYQPVELVTIPDDYATLIMTEANGSGSGSRIGENSINTGAALLGHFLARSYTQAGTSQATDKNAWNFFAQDTWLGGGAGYAMFPNLTNGKIPFMRVYCLDGGGTNIMRGLIPGMWSGAQHRFIEQQGVQLSFTPSNPVVFGPLDGKTLESFVDSVSESQFFVEVSNTWYS